MFNFKSRKRIEILEDSLSSNESIFKLEIERINQYYNEQIHMYENQLEVHEKKFTEKLDKLEQDHRNEIKRINEHYQSMIDTLNLEHAKVIENIRKCKMNEHLIVNDYNSINNLLKEALDKFENKSIDMLEIQNMLKNQFDMQIFTKENELKIREKQLQSKFNFLAPNNVFSFKIVNLPQVCLIKQKIKIKFWKMIDQN